MKIYLDDEVIFLINLNPKLKTKLNINLIHDKLKNYYIYLLSKPKYFHKNFLDGSQKIKQINLDEDEDDTKESKNKKKRKK